MLQKHRSFIIFTSVLRKEGITYQWVFPFKLIVKHKSREVIIRTVQEAEDLLTKLQKREVDSSIRRQEGNNRVG